VVLRDGRPCHVRPIVPDDADRLRRFHGQLSERTVYLRFFAPYPELSEADVARFTTVDHVDRVALVATVGDDIIGVARYDRLGPEEAEVAFTIRDDHQGRGLGSVLLEHLAAAARERGVVRFVAEVLPENRRMQATFVEAGFTTTRQLEDGYLSLEFAIEPTARMRAVMESRERASEARSIRRLLTPGSVAVVGASRTAGSPGHTLLRNLRDAGFGGSLIAVHPEAESILGVPCVRSVGDVPHPVDLAVVAVRAELVREVVDQCAEVGVRGLVVVSTGFSETGGSEGGERERELVARALGNGMRVVGPAALGMLNTDPLVRLNASLAPALPPRGRLGLFCHSGGLGAALLAELVGRGLGVSTFVSAGNRSDVSGNDLLQYWAEDDDTDAVLLYLETLGNPRKFTRVARGLALRKPVAVVSSGRVAHGTLPPAAVTALLAQCGVMQAASARELLDIASLVALQPAPAGPGVAVVATSDRLDALATDIVEAAGLVVVDAGAVLRLPLDPSAIEDRLRSADRAPGVGALLVVHIPPLPGDEQALRAGIRAALPHLTRPLLVVSVAEVGDMPTGTVGAAGQHTRWVSAGDGPGGVAAPPGSAPLFPSVEEAVRALAALVERGRWADRDSGAPFTHADATVEAAEALCGELADAPRVLAGREDGTLDEADFTRKLQGNVRLVALTCASNALGTMPPVAKLIAEAHQAGALVYLDAVHYAPHRSIDVRAWDCDFLACSAYKFFGPHVGILWGRGQLLEELEAYKVRPAPDNLPGK